IAHGIAWNAENLQLTEISALPSSVQLVQITTQQAATDLSGFLGEPPNDGGCKEISAITGQPCKWTAKSSISEEGVHQIEITLKSGETELGSAQAQLMDIGQYPELAEGVTKAGTKWAWGASINVAKGLTGLGIGKVLFENLDKVVSVYSAQNGLSFFRLFCDAAGWGPKLMMLVKPIWSNGAGMWLYELLSPFS
ncbi:MAG: hypothetical protein WC285_06655, partial [Candidatus Gracilibacteria bacterium]